MSLLSNFTQPDTDPAYLIEFLEQVDNMPEVRNRRIGVAQTLVAAAGAKVLDLGCGIGGTTSILAALAGPKGLVAGLDISTAMVDAATRRLGNRAGIEFKVGRAEAIPYPDGFFDAAYSERVFLYLPDRLRVIAELRRVVRPGGRICIVDADPDCIAIYSNQRELTRKLTSIVAAAFPNPTSGRDLPALARRAGLKDLDVVAYGGTTPFSFSMYAFLGVLKQAVARGAVSEAEVNQWLAEQEALQASGDFLTIWSFVRVVGTT